MKSASVFGGLLIATLVFLSVIIVWLMSPTRDVLPTVTRSALVIGAATSSLLTASTSTIAVSPSTSMRPVYAFDPTQAHPGDVIAGWTLEVIGPVSGTSASTSSFENVHAQFSGTSTITGVYEYSMNEAFGQEMICMTVGEPSECAKIPSIRTSCDEPRRFCFTHPERIKQLFGGAWGLARQLLKSRVIR